MTSETPNLHVSKNLNISKTKQDIEKLKTPLRLVWKCCSVAFKIGSKIFSLQWHFKNDHCCNRNGWIRPEYLQKSHGYAGITREEGLQNGQSVRKALCQHTV